MMDVFELIGFIQKCEMQAAIAELVKNPPQTIKHFQPNGHPMSRHERNMYLMLVEFMKQIYANQHMMNRIGMLEMQVGFMHAAMMERGILDPPQEVSRIIQPAANPYSTGPAYGGRA